MSQYKTGNGTGDTGEGTHTPSSCGMQRIELTDHPNTLFDAPYNMG
jgi:hypothetical protein